MACKNTCDLCNRLIISQSVTFASGVLTINIPAGSYVDGQKYCIVIAQRIPPTATVGSPVVITIGTGTVMYPLNNCDCSQLTVCSIKTRRKYSVKVVTTPTGGSFRTLQNICKCGGNNDLPSINGTAPTV